MFVASSRYATLSSKPYLNDLSSFRGPLYRATAQAPLERVAAVERPVLVASLSEHFSSLPDPREAGLVEHKLLDIITLAVCGVICGAASGVEVEEFGKARQE